MATFSWSAAKIEGFGRARNSTQTKTDFFAGYLGLATSNLQPSIDVFRIRRNHEANKANKANKESSKRTCTEYVHVRAPVV